MTVERVQRMREVLARRQPDLRVFMDEVNKTHNFSAIVRSCDAVGIAHAHAVLPKGFRASNHVSGGTGRRVHIHTHPDPQSGLAVLREQGYRLYAAHFSARAVDFRSVDYTVPCAIVVGAELKGVSASSQTMADEHITVPMLGVGHSLNVSVATAVILYEAQRQREAAGLYEQCRLSGQEMERSLFEWLHPRLAQFCKERGLPYPRIDDEGAVISRGVENEAS